MEHGAAIKALVVDHGTEFEGLRATTAFSLTCERGFGHLLQAIHDRIAMMRCHPYALASWLRIVAGQFVCYFRGDRRDMTEARSNHFSPAGDPRMVDVSDKQVTQRTATAEALIRLSEEAFQAVRDGHKKKGDVLSVARLAAIMAAKQTATLIPLCHAIPIDGVDVDFQLQPPEQVRCIVAVRSTGRTGVEMEAMTAASVAALTIYDMCKSHDRAMEIGPVRLLRKSGGASGVYVRQDGAAGSTES